MGRFDFVVYEKQGRSELPILAIELDGKEHFEDAVVKELSLIHILIYLMKVFLSMSRFVRWNLNIMGRTSLQK